MLPYVSISSINEVTSIEEFCLRNIPLFLIFFNVVILGEYLFGKDRSKKLSLEEFEKFYEDIHHDIIKMEFNIYKPVNGKLSEYNFSKFLINSCDFKQDKVEEYLERIESSFGKKLVTGIPYEEVEKLMIAVKDISEIDRAFHMYFMGGLSIPQDEFM